MLFRSHPTERVNDEADVGDSGPGGNERQIGNPEPVRCGCGELPLHQIRMPSRGRIGPGRLHPLRPDRSLDTRCPHEPARLIPADLNPRPASRFPEFPDPIDAIVVFPESDKLRGQDGVTDRPRRRGTVFRGVIRARSYLQEVADGLDSKRATLDDVVLVRVDERDYFRCWRSSSAPKKDAARFRISLARRNSRTSCSSSRIRRASAVVTPAT